jgi:hypothetical protein
VASATNPPQSLNKQQEVPCCLTGRYKLGGTKFSYLLLEDGGTIFGKSSRLYIVITQETNI